MSERVPLERLLDYRRRAKHRWHPLLCLFMLRGWEVWRGMHWLTENRWIADECIDVYDVAPCDVVRIIEAAEARGIEHARRFCLSAWDVAGQCGRPDYPAPEPGSKSAELLPSCRGGVPSYMALLGRGDHRGAVPRYYVGWGREIHHEDTKTRSNAGNREEREDL